MKSRVAISITLLLIGGVILLTLSSANAVGGADDSLALYLPLDEANGNKVTDFSAFNHEAELRGGAQIVPDGIHGNCVELNGEDGIVYVKDHAAFEGTEATIEIWFKTESAENFPIMWKERTATGGDWWVRIEPPSNQIRCLFRDEADRTLIVTTQSPYNDNEWHHMAATVGDNTARIYIDGELDGDTAEATGQFGTMKSTESITLGSRFADAPDTFGLGFLDEARVWSRVLSQEEIQTNMELDKAQFLVVSPGGKLSTTWAQVKTR